MARKAAPKRRKKAAAPAVTSTSPVPSPDYVTELVPLESLRPHPRNYKKHPEEQLAHIAASIKQFGFFKNIVVAKDGTILAGHGVVEATPRTGHHMVPVRRLDLEPDDPRALKLVALDNELPRFGEVDDRQLSELLKDVMNQDPLGLLGTGYTQEQLAALVMVTRPAAEIQNKDAASEWVGMPDYQPGEIQLKLVVTFTSEADRKRFCDEHKLRIDKMERVTWSTRWPFTRREDARSVRFETPTAE